MARHKLPIFTERTLAETRADQIKHASEFAAKLPAVSCKPGCSNCCYHAVHASVVEGILIYQALAARGYWTPRLRKKLEEHAATTWDLSPVVWHLSNIPCPLLEKDRCIAYDSRPFACRVTYSSDDPENCHPHRIDAQAMVPRREALDGFSARQKHLLRRHKTPVFMLPVSKAVLLGEKIATGQVDIERFLHLLLSTASE